MPDQEVGEDRGQLPVDEELDEVVGQYETEHGARERDEHAGETGQTRFGVTEVARAVDQDERAHARGDERHDQTEGVHVQTEPQ